MVGSVLMIFLVFCVLLLCVYVLSSVLWCPLRFTHNNDVRFVFISSCFVEVCMSYLLYLHMCAIVVCSTCCVVFFVLFFFAMLPVSLNCPFLISPSVFSNVYLLSQGCLKNCRIFSFKHFFFRSFTKDVNTLLRSILWLLYRWWETVVIMIIISFI